MFEVSRRSTASGKPQNLTGGDLAQIVTRLLTMFAATLWAIGAYARLRFAVPGPFGPCSDVQMVSSLWSF